MLTLLKTPWETFVQYMLTAFRMFISFDSGIPLGNLSPSKSSEKRINNYAQRCLLQIYFKKAKEDTTHSNMKSG